MVEITSRQKPRGLLKPTIQPVKPFTKLTKDCLGLSKSRLNLTKTYILAKTDNTTNCQSDNQSECASKSKICSRSHVAKLLEYWQKYKWIEGLHLLMIH